MKRNKRKTKLQGQRSRRIESEDTFQNVIKGFGATKDPRQNNRVVPNLKIDRVTANSLYTTNWLGGSVVDTPIDDATRKWRRFNTNDPQQSELMAKAEKEFEIKDKFALAEKWAQVYGGSALLLIIEGQDPEEPLDIDTIRLGALKNLLVLDRYNIVNGAVNRDILSPNFGIPDTYTVSRTGTIFHHTRVIRFEGVTTTLEEFERNAYWGNSKYHKLFDPIMDSQQTSNGIAALVYEAAIDVYRISGLNELVAQQETAAVTERIALTHQMKSIINGILLDKEDEYDKKSANFSNLDSIDDRFLQKVAGASGIPVTKLTGMSPGGLNATGESDMRNYYDLVSGIQENKFRPRLEYVDRCMAKAIGINPEVVEFEFLPLQQLNEVQQADTDLKNAQRDQIYVDQGSVEISDIMAELQTNGVYPSIDKERIEEAREFEATMPNEPEPEPIPFVGSESLAEIVKNEDSRTALHEIMKELISESNIVSEMVEDVKKEE